MAGFSAQGLRGLKSGSTGAKHSSGAPLPAHGWWLNSVPSAEESKCPSFASYQPEAAQLLEATVSPVLRPHPNSKVSQVEFQVEFLSYLGSDFHHPPPREGVFKDPYN